MICQNDGECLAGTCICDIDYTGLSCETHICDVYECENGATCSASNGVITCSCTRDFTGSKCQLHKCEVRFSEKKWPWLVSLI